MIIPELKRSPGGGHGNLEYPHGQRSLAGYSPWGCKQSDMTEWLKHTHKKEFIQAIKCRVNIFKKCFISQKKTTLTLL